MTKKTDLCPTCLKPFSHLRKRRIKNGGPLNHGRPRKVDYSKVVELRKTGLSYRSICQKLGCSIGATQRAVKLWRKSSDWEIFMKGVPGEDRRLF